MKEQETTDMLVWIIIIVIFALAFILGMKSPQLKESNHNSKKSETEPIFDDGEIVGWYDEDNIEIATKLPQKCSMSEYVCDKHSPSV